MHAGAGGSFPSANLTQNHTELPGVLQAETCGAGRVTDASPGPALRRLEDVTAPLHGDGGPGAPAARTRLCARARCPRTLLA